MLLRHACLPIPPHPHELIITKYAQRIQILYEMTWFMLKYKQYAKGGLMNKVATYLNEHLTGEVLTNSAVISESEQDKSVITRRPEMVARVAHVNDIRKIMRFCSQLAEKGHILPVSVRGFGTDRTGAATGKGIMLDLTRHMRRVEEIDPKQQLIHVQAGISHATVQSVLATHKGLGLPAVSYVDEDGTIGGAISAGAAGTLSSVYGTVGESTQRVEVVLSNGDVIQTERISKRELGRKKGLTTLEGDIYRQLDSLLEDKADLIEKLKSDDYETTGYSGITEIKGKDGSIDLTPLFVGSQGSLGIISEAILKSDFSKPEITVVTAAYKTMKDAQQAIDTALDSKATTVEMIDGRIFKRAATQGKHMEWAPKECYEGAMVLAIFADFSERNRAKAVKKLTKKLDDSGEINVLDFESAHSSELHSVLSLASNPAGQNEIVPGVFSGIQLPLIQLDRFLSELSNLEKKYATSLPVFVDASSGFVDLLPIFMMKKISDRQKIVKLSSELAKLLPELGGSFAAHGGDGRFKSSVMYPLMDNEERELYEKIKKIFDPLGILNPGIKSEVPTKELVAEINAWCRLHD